MGKVRCFAIGWLAGVASVVTAALVVEAIEQTDNIFKNGVELAELEAGDELT